MNPFQLIQELWAADPVRCVLAAFTILGLWIIVNVLSDEVKRITKDRD